MFQKERFSRRSFSIAALAFGLLSEARASSTDAQPSFDTLLEDNHRVRLRDGVQLATDVYRPARGGTAVKGRFPAILEIGRASCRERV